MGQVVVNKVTEGPSHMVIRVDMLSDGTGELENYVILTSADLKPVGTSNVATFNLRQLWWGLVWFDVSIGFGVVQPQPGWTCIRDGGPHVDFRSFGGLPDSNFYLSPPPDTDGKLTLSTNDFTAAGSRGTLVIELLKVSQRSL